MNQKTLSSKDLGITYNSGPRTKLLALMIVLLILSMCLNQRHKAKCCMSCGNTCVLSRLLQYRLKSSDHINYADTSTLNLAFAYFRVPYELSLCFMPYPKEINVQKYYSLLYYHIHFSFKQKKKLCCVTIQKRTVLSNANLFQSYGIEFSFKL